VTNLPRAAAFMLAAALLFAVMSVMVKLLSHGLPNAVAYSCAARWPAGAAAAHFASRPQPAENSPPQGAHRARHRWAWGACTAFLRDREAGARRGLLLNSSLPLFIPLVERVWLGDPRPRAFGSRSASACSVWSSFSAGVGLFQSAALVGAPRRGVRWTAQVGVRRLTLNESVTKIVFYFSVCST